MKLITNETRTIHQGIVIRTVEARIRDGYFQYYEYKPNTSHPCVYISDRYQGDLMRYLRQAKLYWDRGEDKTEIDTSLLLSPHGFTGLFFPQYVPNCMDPDYEAWWDGYIIEL